MEVVRLGLSMRALRRRRRWTQGRLAEHVKVSRQTISRIERGLADRHTLRTLTQVATALGATVDVKLLWQGEGLDRLLDSAHADLSEITLSLLATSGWTTATEVTFNIRGECGSIDILAFHEATNTLLVIEIKSVVPDLQSTLATLDRKVRLAPEIARARGWRVIAVAKLLVCRTIEQLGAASRVTMRCSQLRSPRVLLRYGGGSRSQSPTWRGSCSCQMRTSRTLVTAYRHETVRGTLVRAGIAAVRVRIGDR